MTLQRMIRIFVVTAETSRNKQEINSWNFHAVSLMIKSIAKVISRIWTDSQTPRRWLSWSGLQHMLKCLRCLEGALHMFVRSFEEENQALGKHPFKHTIPKYTSVNIGCFSAHYSLVHFLTINYTISAHQVQIIASNRVWVAKLHINIE